MDQDLLRPKPATHLGAYLRHPRTEPVLVFDTDIRKAVAAAERCYTEWPDIQAFSEDLPGALHTMMPQIVSVATPPETHPDVVQACIEAGVPVVICEKPLALSAAAAHRMGSLADQSGTTLLVNHSRRFCPTLMNAAQHLRDGKIGELCAARAWYTGGWWNTGPHLIDLLLAFLGPFSECLFHRRQKPLGTFDSQVTGMLRFGHVDTWVGAISPATYSIFELEVIGSRAAVRIGDAGYRVTWSAAMPSLWFDGYSSLQEAPSVAEPTSWFPPMIDAAVNVLEGGRWPPGAHWTDGASVVDILEVVAPWKG